jgi:hypothetical protein
MLFWILPLVPPYNLLLFVVNTVTRACDFSIGCILFQYNQHLLFSELLISNYWSVSRGIRIWLRFLQANPLIGYILSDIAQIYAFHPNQIWLINIKTDWWLLNSTPQINPLHYLLNFLVEKERASEITLVSMCRSAVPILYSLCFSTFLRSLARTFCHCKALCSRII